MPIFQILIYLMAIKKLKCINDSEESLIIEEIQELQEEMIDRFGEYPEEVDVFIQIAEIKVLCTPVRN